MIPLSFSIEQHAKLKFNMKIESTALNKALGMFVEELKRLNLWDNVAILITSDFGRTLTQNGREGSDHAWGGHYMLRKYCARIMEHFGTWTL